MNRVSKHLQTRYIVLSLRRHLGLTHEQVGKMFGLDATTITGWEQGRVEVPELAFARLVSAQSALSSLLEIFISERLPDVIRRAAPAFNSRRALDWVLEGRIADVARRYEENLYCQLRRTA